MNIIKKLLGTTRETTGYQPYNYMTVYTFANLDTVDIYVKIGTETHHLGMFSDEEQIELITTRAEREGTIVHYVEHNRNPHY